MAYEIRKSNNTLITNLPDYEIDNTTLSINLIGRNASNFGDAQNENFVRMLENFANHVPPVNALAGQIWFDTAVNVLRPIVYDGGAWRPIATILVAPTSAVTDEQGNLITAQEPGDLWFKSDDAQLYINTGTGFSLIGPQAVPGFGTTRFVSTAMTSISQIKHPTIQMQVNGEVIGVISSDSFQPNAAGLALGFPQIYRGLTFKNYSPGTRQSSTTTDVLFHGIVEQLDTSYTRREQDEIITGNWSIADMKMFQFGSAGNAKISFLSVGGGFPDNLTIDHPTGIITIKANGSSLLYSGDTLSPNSTDAQDLGSSGKRFDSVYAKTLNSGAPTTTANINGQWALTTNSKILPHGDAGNDLGTAALRFSNIYTFGLNSGADLGALKGNWQLDTGSQFSPKTDLGNDLGQSIKRFGTVFAGALSAATDADRLVITGDINTNGSIKPVADQQYNIGDPTAKWNTMYAYDTRSDSATIGALNATILQLQDSFQNSITRFDRDAQLTADSDTRVPTQKAVKAYVDSAGVNSGTQIGQIAQQLQDAINALQLQVNNLQTVPTGTVFWSAKSVAPAGYLICDGTAHLATTYPKLFQAIGYTYGGSGGTFLVPDLRGQFIRGSDLGRGVDAGRVFGSTQDSSFASHSHGMPGDDQLSFANGAAGWTARSRGGFSYDARSVSGGGAQVWSTTDEGGADTRPTNVAMLPIIYYR
jgi:microcystin-dependent protein